MFELRLIRIEDRVSGMCGIDNGEEVYACRMNGY